MVGALIAPFIAAFHASGVTVFRAGFNVNVVNRRGCGPTLLLSVVPIFHPSTMVGGVFSRHLLTTTLLTTFSYSLAILPPSSVRWIVPLQPAVMRYTTMNKNVKDPLHRCSRLPIACVYGGEKPMAFTSKP